MRAVISYFRRIIEAADVILSGRLRANAEGTASLLSSRPMCSITPRTIRNGILVGLCFLAQDTSLPIGSVAWFKVPSTFGQVLCAAPFCSWPRSSDGCAVYAYEKARV